MEKNTLYTDPNLASNFGSLIQKQKDFFNTGKTRSYAFRIEQLKKLKDLLKKYEGKIIKALHDDMCRNESEATLEALICVLEVDEAIKNLKKWMAPEKAPANLLLFPSKSKTYYEPYGNTLIISPWNYPFLLTFNPLVSAIAAGNCAIIKPSEVSSHSAGVIKEILEEFPDTFVSVVNGGPEVSEALLKEKFDFIFFTGGTSIGKVVMKAAAEHLTPVVLELGGKSPCIVDETADLDLAARRIIWGKFFNTGQTCIAPDYLYLHSSIKEALIPKMIEAVKGYFSDDPYISKDYGRIINRKHFERIKRLIVKDKVIFGGQTISDDNYIAPTLMDNITWNDPCMKEEIFGPLLPILTYNNLENELIPFLQTKPSPLALYIYTKDNEHEKALMDRLQFGNGCVNDNIMQFNPYQAFGGVGNSGCGSNHGKSGFESFSYRRSIIKRSLSFFDRIFPYVNNKNPEKANRLLQLTRWALKR